MSLGPSPPVRSHIRQDGVEPARGRGPLPEGGQERRAEFPQKEAKRLRLQAGRGRRLAKQSACQSLGRSRRGGHQQAYHPYHWVPQHPYSTTTRPEEAIPVANTTTCLDAQAVDHAVTPTAANTSRAVDTRTATYLPIAFL